MSMKRALVFSIIGAFLLALPASQLAWGKAHVPANKVQVCHKGKVITVSKNALSAHERHGDCQLHGLVQTSASATHAPS